MGFARHNGFEARNYTLCDQIMNAVDMVTQHAYEDEESAN